MEPVPNETASYDTQILKGRQNDYQLLMIINHLLWELKYTIF